MGEEDDLTVVPLDCLDFGPADAVAFQVVVDEVIVWVGMNVRVINLGGPPAPTLNHASTTFHLCLNGKYYLLPGQRIIMSRTKLAIVACVPVVLAGCASEPNTLEVVGSPPTVEVQASCDDGGVTSLVVGFGEGTESQSMLVGNDPSVELLGGVPEYDWAFSLDESQDEANISVTAAATSGECTVAARNADTGEGLERTISGDDELQWIITTRQS